jgi:DNA polymerase (family 10)
MNKNEIAAALEEYSELLHLDNQSGRAHAYEKAARALQTARYVPANPSRLNGIGAATREAVVDLENGAGLDELDELREKYDWYVEMRDVRHIGPKRAKLLHEEYGMDSLEDLALMARADDLTAISGVGPKTSEEMKESIEELN